MITNFGCVGLVKFLRVDYFSSNSVTLSQRSDGGSSNGSSNGGAGNNDGGGGSGNNGSGDCSNDKATHPSNNITTLPDITLPDVTPTADMTSCTASLYGVRDTKAIEGENLAALSNNACVLPPYHAMKVHMERMMVSAHKHSEQAEAYVESRQKLTGYAGILYQQEQQQVSHYRIACTSICSE